MKLLDRLSYTLHFTLYKIHVIIYLLEMPKFQAAAPNSNLAMLEIKTREAVQ